MDDKRPQQSSLPAQRPNNLPESGRPRLNDMVGIPAGNSRIAPFTFVPRNIEEAWRYAEIISRAGCCPDAFRNKPNDVFMVMSLGAELGVSTIQALQNICVINGRLTVWGDLTVALMYASGQCAVFRNDWDEATQTATCTLQRQHRELRTYTFSMADAKRAGLAGKDTYQKFGKRMCGWRAISYGIREQFADVLKGMAVAEELMDFRDEAVRQAPISMPRAAAPAQVAAPAPEPVAQEPEAPADQQPMSDWAKEFAGLADQQAQAPAAEEAPVSPEPAAAPGAPATEDTRLYVVGGVKDQSTNDKKRPHRWAIDLSDGRKAFTWTADVFDQAMTYCEGKMPVEVDIYPHPDTGHAVLKSIKAAEPASR